LLEVKRVTGNFADTRILSGREQVEEGLLVRQHFPLSWDIRIEFAQFPIDIKRRNFTDWSTSRAGMPTLGRDIRMCYGGFLGRTARPSVAWGIEGAVGYSDLGPEDAFSTHFGGLLQTEVRPETWLLESGAGLGAAFGSRVRWARPPGEYDDGIPANDGTTNPMIYGPNAEVMIRSHHFIGESQSIVLLAGYKWMSVYQAWDSRPAAKSKGREVKAEWLEYDMRALGGFTFGVGYAVWWR
jgi:hypothetical protein